MVKIRSDLLEKLASLADQQETDPNQLLENLLDVYIHNDTLMAISMDAVITVDSSHNIIAFNSAAEEIFGYQEKELIGQPLNTLVPGAFRNIHDQHMKLFEQSDDFKRLMNQRGVVYGKHKDGSLFSIEASIAKSKGDDSIQLYVILRDISERVEAWQQLEDSQAYLNLLMDNVNDLVCLHEADGRYKFVSSSSYSILGYQPDEMIGKTPYDYFHHDDLKVIQGSHTGALDGADIASVTYRFRHKEGHYVWLETSTHPIVGVDQQVINLVTSSRDITSKLEIQEALRQERDLLEKIMDTSPSGISVVDKSGQIEFSNLRAEEILRTRKEQQVERSYDSVEWKHTHYDGSPWPDEKQPFVQVMTTRKPVYNVQHAIESSDGQRVLLSINGAPLFDESGEIEKVVFTIEDVTEIKRAEESLQELLEKEREVTALKSRFLSIVSHEFRIPLSVILTTTDLLERTMNEKIDERERSRLNQIRRQVKYLDYQLNQISTFNKSNRTQIELNLEQTFIVDMIQQLIVETRQRYENCPPIKLIAPHSSHESFLLDFQLIQHIVSNLISNAAKYSAGRGEITIVMSCTNRQFLFKIRDEGIGIAQSDQNKLFKFFYRGENVGGIKGAGVGLAIVKQSVKAHGGDITFESQPGVGSTFTVKIPITSANGVQN